MEDQIAKYTKEIFEIENENKLLQSENNQLKHEVETARITQTELSTRNEKLESDCRHLADELRSVLEKKHAVFTSSSKSINANIKDMDKLGSD